MSVTVITVGGLLRGIGMAPILGLLMIFFMLFYKLGKEYPQIIKELLERKSKKK